VDRRVASISSVQCVLKFYMDANVICLGGRTKWNNFI